MDGSGGKAAPGRVVSKTAVGQANIPWQGSVAGVFSGDGVLGGSEGMHERAKRRPEGTAQPRSANTKSAPTTAV